MNQNLFGRLEEALTLQTGANSSIADFTRWLSFGQTDREKNDQREYLKKISVLANSRSPFLTWLKIEVEGVKKLVFTGPTLNISTFYDLRLANPAEFLYFSDFFQTYPVQHHQSIAEVIGAGHKDVNGYSGHDFQSIAHLFSPVYCYESNDLTNTCVSSILTRLSSSLDMQLQINYNMPIIRYLQNSAWIDCRYEETKLASLFCIGTPLQFMHFYWVIESFYFEYSIKDLFQASKAPIPEQEFYKLVEDGLEWRPKEITALSNTVRQTLASEEIEQHCNTICGIEKIDLTSVTDKIEFLCKQIYKFRNTIVHSRHDRKKPTPERIRDYSLICTEVLEKILISRTESQVTFCSCGSPIDE